MINVVCYVFQRWFLLWTVDIIQGCETSICGDYEFHIHRVYSGTCVLWIPWDQPKVSRLSRCPDFPHKNVSFGITVRCVDYAGVHIFKCPD